MKPAGSNQRICAHRRGETRRGADASFRVMQGRGVAVTMGATTMRANNGTKPDKLIKPSVTDQILRFCASGRFGVREAIAAATTPRKTKKAPRQQDTKDEQTG